MINSKRLVISITSLDLTANVKNMCAPCFSVESFDRTCNCDFNFYQEKLLLK